MAKTGTGSAKRYGLRYGRRNREKVAIAEQQYKTKIKCPYCNKPTVKRMAAGIFKCTKEGIVFAGRAYTAQKSDTSNK